MARERVRLPRCLQWPGAYIIKSLLPEPANLLAIAVNTVSA